MKSVLISIQPKWCELIASGKKTVEVRKSKPKIKTPFKVYIYCTKPRHYYKISKHLLTSDESLFLINGKVRMCDGFGVEYEDSEYKHLNCKVIGEFVCDNIDWHGLINLVVKEDAERTLNGTCLTKEEVLNYLGYKKGTNIYDCKNYDFYGWHISNLIIYDKPKELSEFYKYTEYDDSKNDIRPCRFCEHNKFDWSENCEYCEIDFDGEHCIHLQMRRPPQSWCYVEEMR